MVSRPFTRSAADVSSRRTYDILDEPSADDYRSLIQAATAECRLAVLLIRGGGMSSHGQEVLERLRPHLADEPIRGPLGVILRFHLAAQCVEIIETVAPSLYAWRQPDLPEDLCLLRADGGPFLVSIAAERLGYIEMTPLERVRLGRAAPGVASVLAHQAAGDAILASFERRLEDAAAALAAELLAYSRSLTADGRDGLVDALQSWITSGDDVRVAAALEVSENLGVAEVLPWLQELQVRCVDEAAPAVFRRNTVLANRWHARQRRRLDRVLQSLAGG